MPISLTKAARREKKTSLAGSAEGRRRIGGREMFGGAAGENFQKGRTQGATAKKSQFGGPRGGKGLPGALKAGKAKEGGKEQDSWRATFPELYRTT